MGVPDHPHYLSGGRKMKIKCICKTCGKEFGAYSYDIKRGGGIFCSQKCHGTWRLKKRIKCICGECGKVFYLPPSIIKKGGGRFCSQKCYLDSCSKDNFRINCFTCGKEIVLPHYRWKEGRKYFCSYHCRKTSQIIKCVWCQKEIKRKPAEIKKHNFCSRKCMGLWQSKNKRGENSNTWLGGWQYYYGANWKDQKNKARRRDNFICQQCGKTEKELGKSLDVHHKIPFRLFGLSNYEKANDLNNLISLCHICHGIIEPRSNFTGADPVKWSEL